MFSINIIAMKKSYNLKYFYTGLLILTVYIFSACSKDTTYDITGASANKVYVNTMSSYVNNIKYSVLHTPVSSIGNVTAKFPARCTQEAASDLKVTFEVDNSLIEAFNTANKTSYIPVPESLMVVTNNMLTIIKGELSSSDSITISVPAENLSQLTNTGYLIPVRIASVNDAGNTAISTNLNTVYVKITTSWSNTYNSSLIGDVVGTLVTPRTGWSATIDVTLYSGTLAQLFDGSTNSYWQVRPPSKFNLVINLVNQYTGITGIRFNTNSTSYGFTQVIVYSSINGTDWTYQGTPTLSTSSAYQYIKFYAPINAQYIKIETVTFRSTSRVYMAEFDLYNII
jgi:hypothetical protein